MAVVLKRRFDPLQLAAAFDEHLLGRIDQDVADARVAEQRLERTQAEHVVQNFAKERLALRKTERRRFFAQELQEQRANLAFGTAPIRLRQRFEIEPIQQLAMNSRSQLEVLLTRLADRLTQQPTGLRTAWRRLGPGPAIPRGKGPCILRLKWLDDAHEWLPERCDTLEREHAFSAACS